MIDRTDDLRIAVVIPTLNEAETLPLALASLHQSSEQPASIVVADGGSIDNTVAVAQQHGAKVVFAGQRGRGCQIAAALKEIDEEIVLILHADMTVPTGALSLIRERLQDDPTCPGGCLGHKFDNRRWRYRVIEWADHLRAKRGRSYGDQAQFFRRDLLERQFGFPDQSIMEDIELHRRMIRLGRPAYINSPVTVSDRRFERLGWWRVVLGNLCLRMAYRLLGTRACGKLYQCYYGRHSGERFPFAGSI